MIIYLIANDRQEGLDFAESRGWHIIAANRFATPEKDDVRLVTIYNEMMPIPSGTRMIRAYIEHPQAALFDDLVARGGATWIDA